MPNYQDGKIYKIYNTVNDEIYIGSTTRKLSERMAEHRRCLNDLKKQHYPLYQAFREHGVDIFFIELIENCTCNGKDELRKKEGEYIRLLKPSFNSSIAGRTKQEYENENKDNISKRKKQYYEDHKQHIIEQHKQHYEENKESILQRNKRYYEDNNKLINERLTCNICGCQVCRRGMSRHQKSQKCKSSIKSDDNE